MTYATRQLWDTDDETSIPTRVQSINRQPKTFAAVGSAPTLARLTPVAYDESVDKWKVWSGISAVNEVQTITVTATGGTFAILFDGEQTAEIAYDATAAAVQTAMLLLPNLNSGDVVVTGSAGGPYTLTFGGQYLQTDVPAVTTDVTYLSGGTHTAVVVQTTPGVRVNEVASIAVDATGGTFTITIEGLATAAIAFDATAAAVLTAIELNRPGIEPGDIAVTGGPGDDGGTTPYVLTWGGKYLGIDAPAVTTNAGSLTGGAGTAVVTTDPAGSSTNEVQTLTITATSGTFTMTYNGVTTTALAFDASAATVQAALRLLPGLAPENVTVSGSAGGPYTITFVGDLYGIDVPLLTTSDVGLAGGTKTAVVATSTAGVDGQGVDAVKGFVWPDPIVLDASNDVIGVVMLEGEVHYDDIVLPTGESATTLKAALRSGPRALGLNIVGLAQVR